MPDYHACAPRPNLRAKIHDGRNHPRYFMTELIVYLLAYCLLLGSGLLIQRFIVRREYRSRGLLTALPATLQALFFLVYGGFPTVYLPKDWPAVYVNPLFHALGLLLIFGGLGVLLYGMVTLGILRSTGQDQSTLIQTGLYRLTRNPQALACGSYVLGFTLLWPSWYAAGWAILYPILIHAMVLTEEEHLQHTFGGRYEAYCKRVPRYFRWSPDRNDAAA